MARTPDTERILRLLDGTEGLSSARIRRALRLAPERYEEVRAELLHERLVEKYVCRGGGLRLTRAGQRKVREAPPTSLDEIEDAPITTGTGFFVSERGHVLTNAHVIEDLVDGRRIRVSIGGESSLAYVVARDGPNDLALLKAKYKPRILPVFRRGVRVAESIATLGFPLTDYLDSSGCFNDGIVSALAAGDNRSMFQMTPAVHGGNSGGPIFDHPGNVVGLVVSKMDAMELMMAAGEFPQNINFGIKADVALAFLRANGISPTTRAATRELTWPVVYDHAKNLTVFIECNVPDDGSYLAEEKPEAGFWNKFKTMFVATHHEVR
jgi:S1-C subfamily serine protease